MAERRGRVLGNTGATVNIVNPTGVRIPEDRRQISEQTKVSQIE